MYMGIEQNAVEYHLLCIQWSSIAIQENKSFPLKFHFCSLTKDVGLEISLKLNKLSSTQTDTICT